MERYTTVALTELGAKVMCQDCHDDPVLWKVLLTEERKPHARLSKEAERQIQEAVRQHQTQFPTHRVIVMDMKR